MHFIFKGCFHFILYNWLGVFMTKSKEVSFKILLSNLICLTTRKCKQWRNYGLHLSFPFYQPCVMLRNSLTLSAVGFSAFGAGICYLAMIDHCVLLKCYVKGMNSKSRSVSGKGRAKYAQFKTNYSSAYHSWNIDQDHNDKQPGCYRSHSTVINKKDINLNIHIKWVKSSSFCRQFKT